MKTYVPDFTGAWRIVFQVGWLPEHDDLGLIYVAAGIAHPPAGTRRRHVYQLAHYRLHETWPQRR